MPHHTKKKRRHTSVYKSHFPARPTLKEHGFRIISRDPPASSSRLSVNNIHRSIKHLIQRNRMPNKMNTSVKLRTSFARSAKSKHQNKRVEEKLHEDMLKTIKKTKKREEKIHSQKMNELNQLMKRLGM